MRPFEVVPVVLFRLVDVVVSVGCGRNLMSVASVPCCSGLERFGRLL